jgi:hypothetical protein
LEIIRCKKCNHPEKTMVKRDKRRTSQALHAFRLETERKQLEKLEERRCRHTPHGCQVDGANQAHEFNIEDQKTQSQSLEMGRVQPEETGSKSAIDCLEEKSPRQTGCFHIWNVGDPNECKQEEALEGRDLREEKLSVPTSQKYDAPLNQTEKIVEGTNPLADRNSMKQLAFAMAFHSRLGECSIVPNSVSDIFEKHIGPLIGISPQVHQERRDKLTCKHAPPDHDWATTYSSSMSPNKRWLIIGKCWAQQRSDLYESDIDDRQYKLFDLESDEHTFEVEVGSFIYSYNCNNFAGCTETKGSEFEWTGDAVLLFTNSGDHLDLEASPAPDIKSALASVSDVTFRMRVTKRCGVVVCKMVRVYD